MTPVSLGTYFRRAALLSMHSQLSKKPNTRQPRRRESGLPHFGYGCFAEELKASNIVLPTMDYEKENDFPVSSPHWSPAKRLPGRLQKALFTLEEAASVGILLSLSFLCFCFSRKICVNSLPSAVKFTVLVFLPNPAEDYPELFC